MVDLIPLRTNHWGRNEDGELTVLTPEGLPFELTPERLAHFKDQNGSWNDDSAWPKVEAISICRTEGCEAKGREFQVSLGENVDGIFRNICGPCQQPPSLYKVP